MHPWAGEPGTIQVSFDWIVEMVAEAINVLRDNLEEDLVSADLTVIIPFAIWFDELDSVNYAEKVGEASELAGHSITDPFTRRDRSCFRSCSTGTQSHRSNSLSSFWTTIRIFEWDCIPDKVCSNRRKLLSRYRWTDLWGVVLKQTSTTKMHWQTYLYWSQLHHLKRFERN
jgi:hypothetical protein